MRKLLIKILFKLLTQFPQAVNKMSPTREMNAYLFENPFESEELLKSLLTGQMQRFWNQPNDINKAMGLYSKIMLDNHRIARKITESKISKGAKEKEWIKLKIL